MDTENRVTTDTRDRIAVDANAKSTMANLIGWLALVVSIIALVIAWMAYNNSSQENLGEMIQDELRGTTQVEQQPRDVEVDTPASEPVTPGVNDDVMNDNNATAPEDDATTQPNNN